MDHHPFGPSSLGRLYKCPPSYRLSKDEPDVITDDSVEGTLLHRAFERYWRSDMEWREGLEEEQIELVEIANEFAHRFITGQDARIWVEQRVELLNDSGSVLTFGTSDLVIKTPRKHIIIDLKFGRKIDDDALVLQLATYLAALASGNDPKEDNVWYEAWAFFPRLQKELKYEHEGPAAALVADVIEKFEEIQRLAADETLEPQPGEHCTYCRALATCPAVLADTQLALEESEAIAETDSMLARADEIAGLYDMAALAEKRAKALRGRIRAILAEHPNAFPGLELKTSRGKRKTDNLLFLLMRLVPEHLTKGEWDKIVKKDVSPVDAEAAFVSKYYEGRGKGKPTLQQLKERFAEVAGNAIKAPDQQKLRRL